MACFLIPAAEAAVIAAAAKAERKREARRVSVDDGAAAAGEEPIRFSRKLAWLRNMLLGGSFLLAFEHVWHGEVTPWFPFLTAMRDPGETAAMLREMGTVGVAMALLVTAVWAGMALVTDAIARREAPAPGRSREAV